MGELIVADIGIPKNIDLHGEGTEVATPERIRQWLPPRPLDGHKGTFGKALVVAGSVISRALPSWRPQRRCGPGRIGTLAVPNVLHTAIAPAVPEATYVLLPHTLECWICTR